MWKRIRVHRVKPEVFWRVTLNKVIQSVLDEPDQVNDEEHLLSLDTTLRHAEQKGGRTICPNSNVVNIAAVGDVHCPSVDPSYLKAMLKEIETKADVLLLCGDLTHEGHPSEAAILAELLAPLRCPTIGVLSNHDYEMGEANIIT